MDMTLCLTWIWYCVCYSVELVVVLWNGGTVSHLDMVLWSLLAEHHHS